MALLRRPWPRVPYSQVKWQTGHATAAEMATALGVSRRTLRRYIRDGFPAHQYETLRSIYRATEPDASQG